MNTLHVLIIEDSENDAELVLRQLKKAQYSVYYERVESAEFMKAALDMLVWDVIIADNKLPQFDASSALALLQETGLDIPFIIVSGKIGEENAVELMKSGAHDYVMKNKLIRLGPVIKREIAEAQMRRERKQTEEALRESEERYRYLVEVSPDAIVVYANEILVYVNPAAVKLIGAHDKSEMIGRPILDIIHPDDKDSVRQRMKNMKDHGLPRSLSEEKFLTFDGRVVFAEISSVPITFQGRAAIQVIARDITERKRAEDALRVSEERYRALSEAAYDMIYIINRDDIVVYANVSAADLFNKQPVDIIGKKRSSLFPPEMANGQMRSLQQVFDLGIPKQVESKVSYSDQVIWLSTWLVPMRDEKGQVTSVMGVSRDITNRKWLEDDKQKLLNRLQEALAQVKTLGGLLPICSMCKKIRDDKGYWQQVEGYIQSHTGATFTHGVCPDCFPKLYPDFESSTLDETKKEP